MASRRLLTPEQERELLAQYELGRNNRPKKLAERFGISIWSVNNYVRRARNLDLISLSDRRTRNLPGRPITSGAFADEIWIRRYP